MKDIRHLLQKRQKKRKENYYMYMYIYHSVRFFFRTRENKRILLLNRFLYVSKTQIDLC